MPPAFGFMPKGNIYDGAALGPLLFHLLPDVEQQNLFRQSRYRPKSQPQQDFFFYTANGVHRTQVPIFNCPSDGTHLGAVNENLGYAPSSYAANYLVFGVVDEKYVHVKAQGRATLASTFHDGTSHTILFAEKYALSTISAADHRDNRKWRGGCHWAYFQADCNGPFFAYYYRGHTDRNSVGPLDNNDPRDSRYQVRPSPARTNPCLPSTPHAAMNTAMADGSVRQLAPGMNRVTWWALVTPRGGNREP